MRAAIRQNIQRLKFLLGGKYFRLGRKRRQEPPATWHLLLEERQPIHQTELSTGKIINLRRALANLNGIVLGPGQYFSWWHSVPQPRAQNGFALGRTLVGGEIVPDYGGGLCQLSGLIYLAALQLGCTILERHAHTVDIYRDEERYTPLGADAAIAYGYKNLLFKNASGNTFLWLFTVENEVLGVKIYAPVPAEKALIRFEMSRDTEGHRVTVTTLRQMPGGSCKKIDRSVYRRLA